jgi:hypothetical protein
MAKSDNRGLIARMRAAPTYVSVPIGVLLVLGGTVFAFLPVLGPWMAPIGLAILAPNIPAAGRLSRRMLRWSIRRGFVRIKRVEQKSGQEGLSPPSDA